MKIMLIFSWIRNCYFPYYNWRRSQKTAKEITCLWVCKSGMSKSYHSNSWDWDYYYLKACPNLGSETQKTQMLAETMATAFRKQNEGRFTCGDKNHLKKDCPKKANKRPPKICPRCHKGIHWAKECKSKFDIERKPIPGNSNQGPPKVPFNKNQGQIPSFPSNPQHLAVLPSIYQL